MNNPMAPNMYPRESTYGIPPQPPSNPASSSSHSGPHPYPQGTLSSPGIPNPYGATGGASNLTSPVSAQQQSSPYYGMPQQQQKPPPPSQQPPYMSMSQRPTQPQQSQRPEAGQEPQPESRTRNGLIYELIVKQEPIRARMCGFGDKDRRPITPPPCVLLLVRDAKTGDQIDINNCDLEPSYFVVTVDLWNAAGDQEVALVRHSAGAPTISISTSTTTSYPPPQERLYYMPYATPQHYGGAMQQHAPYVPQQQGGYYAPNAPLTPVTPGGYGGYGAALPGQAPMPMVPAPVPPQQGMFTKNLIGSTAVNAFKLKDVQDKWGFWFILQDLSIRTEGQFRLKFSFTDVGNGNGSVNQGTCPILAKCYSQPFQVYSAKKFPGVIESTDLSKKFANQGIKIPIRKDGPKNVPNQDEYDADDN